MDVIGEFTVYKTILYATDLKENHFDLCEKAVKLAESLNATLYFLHVIEIPASLQWAQSLGFAELAAPRKEGAQMVMSLLGDALNIPAAQLYVETGSAYTHILSKLNELGCDLVILGNQSNNSLPSYLGSTAHAVVHHALCDVLTLKTSSIPQPTVSF